MAGMPSVKKLGCLLCFALVACAGDVQGGCKVQILMRAGERKDH